MKNFKEKECNRQTKLITDSAPYQRDCKLIAAQSDALP